MKKDKKEKISAKVFRNNAYMMKLAWKISPGRVAVAFIDNVLDRINWIFTAVIFMRLIINGKYAEMFNMQAERYRSAY